MSQQSSDTPAVLKVTLDDGGSGKTFRKKITVGPGITEMSLFFDGSAIPEGTHKLKVSMGNRSKVLTFEVKSIQKRIDSILTRTLEKGKQLRKRVETGKRQNLNMSLPDVSLLTAECFNVWIKADRNRRGGRELALREATRLEEVLNKALKESHSILNNTGKSRAFIAAPDVRKAVLRGSNWYVGNRPVMMLGVSASQMENNFIQMKPILERLGMNLTTVYAGSPNMLYHKGPEADMEKLAAPLAAAQRMVDSGSFMTCVHSFHGMPRWMKKQYPDIACVAGHYIGLDINHPQGPPLVQKFYEKTARTFSALPGQKLYWIGNEPVYFRVSPKWGMNDFRKAMTVKYKTIAQLNAAWNTVHKSFDDIKPIRGLYNKTKAAYVDFCRWNDARVLAYNTANHKAMKKGDPKALSHISFVNSGTVGGSRGTFGGRKFKAGHWSGNDRYAAGQLLDLNGCDTRPGWWDSKYSFEWLTSGMSFDLQRSMTPDKPIYDHEWHGIQIIGAFSENLPEEFLQSSLWFSFLHGMDMVKVWFWSRDHEEPGNPKQYFKGSLCSMPQLVNQLGRTYINVQRHAAEVQAFQDVSPVRILFSKPSAILDLHYMDIQRYLYENLNWLGYQTGFVTEETLLKNFNDFKVLFVPAAKNVSPGVRKKIQALSKKGIQVVFLGDKCLSLDEHSKPLVNPTPINALKLSNTPKFAELKKIVYNAVGVPEILCIASEGAGSKPVEFRTVKMKDGRLIGYFIGLSKTKDVQVQVIYKGKPAVFHSLLTGKKYKGELTAPPFFFDLVEFQKDTSSGKSLSKQGNAQALMDYNNPLAWEGMVKLNMEVKRSGNSSFELYGKYPTEIISSQMIPIDPKKTYTLSAWMRSLDAKLPASGHLGLRMYDKKKRQITIRNIAARVGSETTLATDVVKGSKEFYIRKNPAWLKGKSAIVVFNAKDKCEDLPNYAVFPLAKVIDKGEQYKVIMRKALRRSYPAGTKLRLHAPWGSPFYGVAKGWMPIEWKKFSASFKGESERGYNNRQILERHKICSSICLVR